jgi:hypothetical protein
MPKKRTIVLDRIRTDGWFERLGESIGSFQTLCDVLGERFFAFSLIAQARVSSLMIDRFNSNHSLVEYCFSGLGGPDDEEPERHSVVEFRRRVVERLLRDEPAGPAAEEVGDDLEALQRHIGPRLLLLAPLYGYGLRELVVDGGKSSLRVEHEAEQSQVPLGEFRRRILEHVREDLERGVERSSGTAIDLNHVAEAEKAASEGSWEKVIQLLGSWPMPLSVYWRTPDGQALAEAARQRIADGLGLLGMACAKLGDSSQGEEVMRLAVQYAQVGASASRIFARLGRMLMDADRHGEAIAPLRRASMLAAGNSSEATSVLVDLAKSYQARGSKLAALACTLSAEDSGASKSEVAELKKWLDTELGDSLQRWKKLVAQK